MFIFLPVLALMALAWQVVVIAGASRAVRHLAFRTQSRRRAIDLSVSSVTVGWLLYSFHQHVGFEEGRWIGVSTFVLLLLVSLIPCGVTWAFLRGRKQLRDRPRRML